MSFRTAEPALKDVLDNIAKGSTQLPDFQRGWVWDDNHIKSLIAIPLRRRWLWLDSPKPICWRCIRAGWIA
jgi:hypothetical protein